MIHENIYSWVKWFLTSGTLVRITVHRYFYVGYFKILSFAIIWYIFLRHIFLKQQCHFCFHFRKAFVHFPVIIRKLWVFNVKLRRIFWFRTGRSISNATSRLNIARGYSNDVFCIVLYALRTVDDF